MSPPDALLTSVKELLDNALDASSGRGGTVVGGEGEAIINISITAPSSPTSSFYTLTVTDKGCGISSIPKSLVLFSSSTKSTPESKATGRFGLGLTSTLLRAWGETEAPCRVSSKGACYNVEFDLDEDKILLSPAYSVTVTEPSLTVVSLPVSPSFYSAGVSSTLQYLSLLCHVPSSLASAVSFSSPSASILVPTGRPEANFLSWGHKLTSSSSTTRHTASVTLYTHVVPRVKPRLIHPHSLGEDKAEDDDESDYEPECEQERQNDNRRGERERDDVNMCSPHLLSPSLKVRIARGCIFPHPSPPLLPPLQSPKPP